MNPNPLSEISLAEALVIFLLLSSAAAALTWLVRRHALATGILDRPNARSSHTVATPRGGGVSIVAVTSAATLVGCFYGLVDGPLAAAVTIGGGAIAAVGYLDDRGDVSVRMRLIVHLGSAVLAVWLLGGLGSLQFGAVAVDLGWGGDVLAVLTVVWMLNLFNFMDGIDGIASMEAAFVAIAGALIAGAGGPFAIGLAVGAASLGFLIWNWAPARIFMGDAGSGYLGYVLAVLALAAGRQDPVAVWTWSILAAVFLADATVTLVRRMIRGERVYEAHRSHAYQHLARRWQSHAHVTLSVLLVNGCLLLPCAWWAHRHPDHASYLFVAVLGAVAGLALLADAGKKD